MALFANMALKATQGDSPYKYLGVIDDGSENQGYLEYSTDQVLSQNAKFAVEYASNHHVHIRSCLTNKYWIRSSSNGSWIVAQGGEPVDDETSWNCTLFRVDMDNTNNNTIRAKFVHVQSGRTVRIPNDDTAHKMLLSIDLAHETEAVSDVVNYNALVVLPKYVVFKGSNGLYYQNYSGGGYASFSVSDIGDPDIVCETQNNSDGALRVKVANYSTEDMFWTVGISDPTKDGLIAWAGNILNDKEKQFFDVIRVSNDTVALRCQFNKKICMRADWAESVNPKDRLVAKADGVVSDAHLEVVEAVFERSVNVYQFDFDRARIYNVELLYSDEHIWDNYTDVVHTGAANGTIITARTYTFNNTVNVSGSVKTTFQTGIPFIAEGKIETSATASYAHQWAETVSDTQQIGDVFTVQIAPKATTIARGVATKGSCDVPFAYIQTDYRTDGGPPRVTKLRDGVFTGANAYSFHSQVRYEDLPPDAAHLAPTECIKRLVVPAPN